MMLSTGQSLAGTGGSIVVLGFGFGLRGVGFVALAAALISAVAGSERLFLILFFYTTPLRCMRLNSVPVFV